MFTDGIKDRKSRGREVQEKVWILLKAVKVFLRRFLRRKKNIYILYTKDICNKQI